MDSLPSFVDMPLPDVDIFTMPTLLTVSKLGDGDDIKVVTIFKLHRCQGVNGSPPRPSAR